MCCAQLGSSFRSGSAHVPLTRRSAALRLLRRRPSLPASARLFPESAKSGSVLAEIDRSWRIWKQFGPSVPRNRDIDQSLVNFGPDLAHLRCQIWNLVKARSSLPKVYQFSGIFWHKRRPNLDKLKPKLPQVVECSAKYGDIRKKVRRFWPISQNEGCVFCQHRPKLGEIWAELDRRLANSEKHGHVGRGNMSRTQAARGRHT